LTDPVPWLFALEQFGIKFGLENISTIVARLGHPERAFRSVHIAGTNGKGSVTAMVDAALRAAGHRSARYTSPHLIDLSERFVIDGRPVAADALAASVSHVRGTVDGLIADGELTAPPTFFEVTTAVAFELFRRAGVDVAVLEVGLGGRLDATNVVAPPSLVATAITSIAFDHQRYLGTTLDHQAGCAGGGRTARSGRGGGDR
jgi:dihydrofolate synthase/folylpolyglutamate synthase